MLLAWLVIFAHGIIPHNHEQDIHEGCSGLIHTVSVCSNSSEKSQIIVNQPDDEKVCHFSSFMFKQIEQDNFIFPAIKDTKICAPDFSVSIPEKSTFRYNSVPYFGKTPLRGPPVA